jgi:glycine cleavage system H protein
MKAVLTGTDRFEVRTDLVYHRKEHLWIRVAGNRAVIGMEPLEIESKGAIVVVQFEEVGTHLKEGDRFGSMEAEKHVGMLKSPVSGRIMAVNQDATRDPRLVSRDPYGSGWMIEVELAGFDPSDEAFVAGDSVKQWHAAEVARYTDEGWLAE